MEYFSKEAIRNVLSQNGLIVGDIDLNEDEYIADVYVEVNSVGLYLPHEIIGIAGKISLLEYLLTTQGFIHDIKFGDLYQGNWRILIHFLNKEEIEKWEENAVKRSYII